MSFRDRVIPVLLLLVLSACNGTSETTTTSGDRGQETTVYPTITTTETPTTSTRPPTTTSSTTVESGDLPFAQPDDPEFQVLFSIPAGPDGVTYEGGFPDWETTGPQALTVASDGSIWIADTNGRRLLHLADDGSRLATIDTDAYDVGGLIDVVAVEDGVWGLEIVPALNRHRLVFFNDSGELVDAFDLPTGLHLEDGLWGIAATPNGQLWIELEGGARVYTAFDEAGTFSPQPAEGYEIQGVTMRPVEGIEGNMARFDMGDVTIERPVRELGALAYEGAIPGWVALLLSDVAFDEAGALTVDLEVLYTDLAGNIAATATYPLDEVASATSVPQDFIAVGPDGRLIAMKPESDSLEIIELSLFPTDRS
jgi:hypothetical protein